MMSGDYEKLSSITAIALESCAFLVLPILKRCSCNTSTWEVEAGRTETQGYLWLHSKLEGSLGNMKSRVKKFTKQRRSKDCLLEMSPDVNVHMCMN